MDLSAFKTLSFPEALKAFYNDLGILVNYIDDAPALASQIWDIEKLKNDALKNALKLIDKVYVLAMVDDATFVGKETFSSVGQIKGLRKDYDGLLLLGVTLHQNLNPTRSQLAEIARALNREFRCTPVTVVFQYTNCIAFANTERIPYKQEWREGERISKVTLLKDVNIEQTHSGHLRILKQLKISTSGSRAITGFTQLYYYWQSIFSISVLNKEFYKDIITWFNCAIKDIRIPSEKVESEKHKDFTVRLIARLIFIWFLKELKVVKEELLVPEFQNGEKNNLIIPKNNGTSYYKFILQNLFFNALNSDKNDRDKNSLDVYGANFSDAKAIKEAIFFSPYLNGGLFDIHPNDWCTIDSTKLHIVNNAFIVPDHLFLDKVNGLNGILARYKFTIAENTPLEEEVAVDPEMLGRIFENLLAEQSSDTQEAARKNTGAFYTPRPVVSYMCRSTLLKHLDTEVKPENSKIIIKKLLETTVIDPACGSGAFPMGMLEEMMQVLTSIDPSGMVWVGEMMKSKDETFREHIAEMFADGQIRYVKKLGLLRNCLFGVDLLEYAIEITKLRCWLSLIVEQKVDLKKENYNLKPLPNLEFKFYKKNSLYRFYKDKNINTLIDLDKFDGNKLLSELVNLENQYFITKTDRHGSKEEIKEKIIKLLESLVDDQSNKINKQFKSVRSGINEIGISETTEKQIAKLHQQEKTLAQELAELAVFKDTIKDYFIERVVFPGIFNKEKENPGFDIVIGNPPYVSTKLISSMGQTEKLKAEYNFCDDLYNHFTFRGLELLKSGGLLSYITSDTFLVILSKENMRKLFIGEGLICKLVEIVNTPKAFAAMVDTAIFTLKKEKPTEKDMMNYIDLRFPKAESFGITDEEWSSIKKSSDNLAGWEKVLNKAFSELGQDAKNINWSESHTCDNKIVLIDKESKLLKYRTDLFLFCNSLNYSIFPPSEYNSELFDKIIKPAWPTLKTWWTKVQTSKKVDQNRSEINHYLSNLKPGAYTFLGVLADGGVGLQTGDNGQFVGVLAGTKTAGAISEARPKKLLKVVESESQVKEFFAELKDIEDLDSAKKYLEGLAEVQIRTLFDAIKQKFGLRIFGKGFIYRIISPEEIKEIDSMTSEEKENGIDSIQETYVRYDKGDRDGNKWLSETIFGINWNKNIVTWLQKNSGKSGVGMPVVRNPQFYFKSGFSWNIINGTRNTNNLKFKYIIPSVNDVGGMKLTSSHDAKNLVTDKFLCCLLNSFLNNRLTECFINFTVNFQMNDARQIPIIIPSKEQLDLFEQKYDKCFAIQENYFLGKLDKDEARQQLCPVEREIDEMVNRLYGIVGVAKYEIVLDDVLESDENEEE